MLAKAKLCRHTWMLYIHDDSKRHPQETCGFNRRSYEGISFFILTTIISKMNALIIDVNIKGMRLYASGISVKPGYLIKLHVIGQYKNELHISGQVRWVRTENDILEYEGKDIVQRTAEKGLADTFGIGVRGYDKVIGVQFDSPQEQLAKISGKLNNISVYIEPIN